ncbi:MAG: hypothetical protein WEC17_01420 [Candidatus Saccharimonadales bacterium]
MSLHAPEALVKLRIVESPIQPIYKAAEPGYQRNFSRDSLTFGILADDAEALEAQITHSFKHQGNKVDPYTGEEPGKIHHEWPGVFYRDRETTYNACDSTALTLLAIARLVETGKPELLSTYGPNIEAALEYIYSHTGLDNLFREDPSLAGADRFALKVTYWKDSVINGGQEEPAYPIIYTLAHFQNAAALRAMGRVMNRPNLIQTADDMEQAGINRLWLDGHFVTAVTANEVIDPPSSDSLHALLYIKPASESLPSDAAEGIEEYMRPLGTTFGYRAGIPINGNSDNYHTKYVWPHEQALMHAAAKEHRLMQAQEVARRVVSYCNSDGNYWELVDAEDGSRNGNRLQLWVIGAIHYFNATAGRH